MPEVTTIKDSDLVLKISQSYDISKFDMDKYEAFLDKLCGTREYQKEAIRNACIYLLWKRYNCLKDLASENYDNNKTLQLKYWDKDKYLKNLHFANKLACNIDLATWTWKSYVIYWIAQIMLCEWVVDRVLVLCPSVTIEEWLTEKFKALASDPDILRLLPNKWIKTPRIKQADSTIESWDICIENIHSTYKNTKSAIEDSLLHHGETTLILNDEAHHIYSKVNQNVKKWKEFLEDIDYWFKYIVWFSWTPYIDDEYFTDIIYRYSLNDAIEEKFIKDIDYVTEDTIRWDSYIKMQVIYQNHEKIKQKYGKVKPITIVISKDIAHCKQDRQTIIDYLVDEEWYSKEKAEEAVLIVTSDKEHKENLEILKKVRYNSNPVEWICSVAMLTEWWDVPNVFQIVPSEEKAFNSKLLISQVLWRWLRIPEEYKWEKLHVKVLNHEKFSHRIKHLVDEVLERDDKMHCYPIEKKKQYNFDIYNLIYDRTAKDEKNPEMNKPYDYSKMKEEWINIPTEQVEWDISVTYTSMWSWDEYDDEIHIKNRTIEIDELAQSIHNKLNSWDIEMDTHYSDEFTFDVIKEIIQKSLDKRWLTEITPTIESAITNSFNTIRRWSAKVLRYDKEPKDIQTLNTEDINWYSVSLSTLLNKKWYVFYDENTEKYSNKEDLEILETLKNELWPKYLKQIPNTYTFKTSFNCWLIQNSEPEKKFIDKLVDDKNAKTIDAWCKSKDKWFYEIEFGWRKWEHTVIDHFNPDFFIKQDNKIIVVEIKEDNAIRDYHSDFKRNRKKYFAAKEHFELLNEKLKENWIDQTYYFHFCTPNDYWSFFWYLRSNNIDKYLSNLDWMFENTISNDTEIKDTEVKDLDLFDKKDLERQFWDNWNNLEEWSKIFLITSEKNYQNNKDVSDYNFSPDELIKTFELELRIKLFDKMRDDEDIALEIIDKEEKNTELVDYFKYASDKLVLWAMENALRYNPFVKKYIEDNYSDSWFFILKWFSGNYDFIKYWEYDKVTDSVYSELPNIIALLRLKYRNLSAHWDKITKREEYEKLRDLLIFWKWVLVKLEELLNN